MKPNEWRQISFDEFLDLTPEEREAIWENEAESREGIDPDDLDMDCSQPTDEEISAWLKGESGAH